tara:strand:- start:269 stop:556 length:288 start_codon:yes stop_codon:yes gene_type:complete
LQDEIEFKERDFFINPFNESELRDVVGVNSPADIFSWKSPSFRKLAVEPDSLDDEEMISLMLKQPRLIRRPLLIIGDRLIVGVDPGAIRVALSSL